MQSVSYLTSFVSIPVAHCSDSLAIAWRGFLDKNELLANAYRKTVILTQWIKKADLTVGLFRKHLANY